MKKNQKNAKKRKRAKTGRVKTTYVFRDDHRYRISFNILFTIILIFLGGLGAAVSYAYIGDTQSSISKAREELQTQKETNAALRAEITQKYTLDEVERIATERLGMSKPDISQIIHINVPKQSVVILNDEIGVPETESTFQIILSFFKRLFE